jgi:hypothetical protein
MASWPLWHSASFLNSLEHFQVFLGKFFMWEDSKIQQFERKRSHLGTTHFHSSMKSNQARMYSIYLNLPGRRKNKAFRLGYNEMISWCRPGSASQCKQLSRLPASCSPTHSFTMFKANLKLYTNFLSAFLPVSLESLKMQHKVCDYLISSSVSGPSIGGFFSRAIE